MKQGYNFKEVENKWQKIWDEKDYFKAVDFHPTKPKCYVLYEFPNNSGHMHLGHPKMLTPADIYARYKRFCGYNVLFPHGTDDFGTPGENFAIRTGGHPSVKIKEGMENFRNEFKKFGFSFDWSREINSSDENYYKWTQWIFLKLFENGMAYKDKQFVNYCIGCKSTISNEDMEGEVCERCGSRVEQRERDVWFLKMKNYADKLLEAVEDIDMNESINIMQRNWIGKKVENGEVLYNITDWGFNRQRYWGEPFPVIHCDKCGWVSIPESELPLKLPFVEDYKPNANGDSPLSKATDFVNCKCPNCGKDAKRETDTMPNWAGSSWYWLRFMDPLNDKEFASKEKQAYWGQVDMYCGGNEHVCRHILYADFWQRFLYDYGYATEKFPFKVKKGNGLVCNANGKKLSKRDGAKSPTEYIGSFGADTMRMHTLFLGGYEDNVVWSDNGIVGIQRLFDKIWNLQYMIKCQQISEDKAMRINEFVKNATTSIENFEHNTFIAKIFTFIAEIQKEDWITKEEIEKFMICVNPYAPHITSEIFENVFAKDIAEESWPIFDEKMQKSTTVISIQINGKHRASITAAIGMEQTEAEKMAMKKVDIKPNSINKIIFVKDRVINFII